MSEVRYLPIAGFPGYWVGDDGSVWSTRPPSKFHPQMGWWRRLKPQIHKKGGHLYVNLYPEGGGRFARCWVHALVLEAFVGPRPPGMFCRHFPDRDPKNNRPENLQWATPQRNNDDKYVHGTMMFGLLNPRAKLGPRRAREIRKLLTLGHSQESLAARFGVGQSTISRIHLGKVWPEKEDG